MTAIVDIYNMALMRIGHSTQISDPDTETTNAANLCRTFYPICRDTVLRASNWNFATKRASLALLSDTVTNWNYAYAYPTDCIIFRGVVIEGYRLPPAESRIPFEVGNLAGVKVIFTDEADAEGLYTCRVEDPNLMDAMFISAVSWLLAAEIALPLVGKPDMSNNARQGYMMTLSAAASNNLNEGELGPPPDCEFIRARGTSFNVPDARIIR